MLNFVDRYHFSALEKHHGTGHKPRKFSRWYQYVYLLFMQVIGRKTLRDGIQSMNSRANNLYHQGAKSVPRSTFADASNKRSASFYKALFVKVNQHSSSISQKQKLKFKNMVYSLEATVIDLALDVFTWAYFRNTKAVMKLHTLLNHSGYLPAFVSITDGKTHEIQAGRSISLPKGSFVVEDRTYTDYQWFACLGQEGIFSVTRQKSNTVYIVIEHRPINKNKELISDQAIIMTGTEGKLCPCPFRRIG